MRLLLVLALLSSASCIKKSEEGSTSSGAINRDAPYLWGDYSAPKTVQISDDFDNAEVTNIEDMGNAWKTALSDQKTFFSYGARVPELTVGLADLDTLLDDTFGIYKTTTWHSSLPASALAVTQIYGRRHNVGSNSEYVEIEHADIIVNYDWHSFRTGNVGAGYDLQTVILHEMGHFMGLQHSSSSKSSSIMYPSINSGDNRRTPLAQDIETLAELYDIDLGGGGGGGFMVANTKVEYKPDPKSTPVRVLFELHADGECVHKIDGVSVKRHRLEIK